MKEREPGVAAVDATPYAMPDSGKYNPDPTYLRQLLTASGLSRVEAAERIGVSPRTMRAWLAGDEAFPYAAQYALERLTLAGPTKA